MLPFRDQPMEIKDIFLNKFGRLRSGWRFAISGLTIFFFISLGLELIVAALQLLLGPAVAARLLDSRWGFLIQGFTFLITATLIGWACGKLFEDLPLRALGWAFHRGWLKDFLVGSLIGMASLLMATAFTIITGSLSFSLNAPLLFATAGKTALVSIPVFIVAAAAEEAIFRGYP